MGSTEQRLTEQADRHPPGSGAADLALIRRVQQGDRSAFDLLVVKYQHKIVKLIMRYVRDSAEALDVAQEAFLKAYRAAPSFRGDSAFYTWLYRIAINTAKNHLVATGRKPDQLRPRHTGPRAGRHLERAPRARYARGAGSSEEMRDTINRAIHALPEELRTAILLREIEGLSYEEIAQTMECPVGTVRSRIFRAREAIDRALAPFCRSHYEPNSPTMTDQINDQISAFIDNELSADQCALLVRRFERDARRALADLRYTLIGAAFAASCSSPIPPCCATRGRAALSGAALQPSLAKARVSFTMGIAGRARY